MFARIWTLYRFIHNSDKCKRKKRKIAFIKPLNALFKSDMTWIELNFDWFDNIFLYDLRYISQYSLHITRCTTVEYAQL